jgi:ATP/maltotriose-dependent transcriptional regulator MalT
VLARQPERVHTFLLQTSILGQLSGPLCDAVTGQGGGKAMLEALDRGNLFLVSLDDRRRWYRYHHLFADVLQARLLDEQPGQVPDLHRRASEWYEQNGEQPEAVRHALAAGDFERAAGLVELAIPAMRRTRQEAKLRGWLEVIPDELVRVRPVLSVGFAGALLAVGELEGVEGRLRDAERWLGTTTGAGKGPPAPSAEMVVADEEEFHRLPATIELYRSALALARGDVPGTVRHARRAISLMPTFMSAVPRSTDPPCSPASCNACSKVRNASPRRPCVLRMSASAIERPNVSAMCPARRRPSTHAE